MRPLSLSVGAGSGSLLVRVGAALLSDSSRRARSFELRTERTTDASCAVERLPLARRADLRGWRSELGLEASVSVLDSGDGEDGGPVGFVVEGGAKRRLGFRLRGVELDHLLEVEFDETVEDHALILIQARP